MSFISASYSVKKLSDKRFTSENTALASEAFQSPLDINANEIYTDFRYIPTSSNGLPYSGSSQHLGIVSASVTDPTISAGDDVAVLKYWYRKKVRRGNQGGRDTFFFVEDDGFGANDPVFNDQLITSSQQTNFISTKYIDDAGSVSNTTEDNPPGYNIQVRVGTNAASSTLVADTTYNFDYKQGILSFFPNQTPAAVSDTSNFVFITAYQYVGRTLNSQLADGSLGGTATTVTVTDDNSTNEAYGLVFADTTGSEVNLKSDGDSGHGLTYNPSTQKLKIGDANEGIIIDAQYNGSSNTHAILSEQAIDTAKLFPTSTTVDLAENAGILNIGSTADSTTTTLSGQTINIGKANGTTYILGSASIAGDLTVQGVVTSIQTTDLNVEDQFILLNSGSVEQDGGIIVQTDTSANGTALFYDHSSNRWALAQSSSVAWNSTSATAQQYVVSVSSSAAAPTGNPTNFGLDDASWYGMMYVDTSDTADGGLYIYLP